MASKHTVVVEPLDPGTYRVTIRTAGGESVHVVEADAAEVARLGGGAPAETLVEESFRFLLEREPPGSILARFELGVIADYFPDYPSEIRARLEGARG